MKKKRFDLPIPFGWFTVALSKDLNKGDVVPLSYFDRDLVLFRTESGTASVTHAICPHLGAHLGHGGKVHGESIACPFHGWEFNGEGFCTDVPYANNMPPRVKDKQCLPSYPVTEINGTIWVWYHPEQAEPSYEVEAVPEMNSDDWVASGFAEWTVHAPVQETGENAVDIAHFAYVHSAQNVPEGEVNIEGHRRETQLTSMNPNFTDDGKLIEGEFTETYLNSANVGPGQTCQRFTGIFETVMMGTITPIDDESIHLRFIFAQPKGASKLNEMLAKGLMDNICHQVEQDIPIWDNKHYAESPILCDSDGPIAQYRKWFSQFYA